MLTAEKITLEELLEAGVHFGHQRRRWHPRMALYIHATEKGVHILDLAKTRECLISAAKFLNQTAKKGGAIIFVGTKRQAKEIVETEAKRCGAMFMTERWIGGLVTNFGQVRVNIERLNKLRSQREKGELAHYTKKERLGIDRRIAKLEAYYGGIDQLSELPAVIVLASARKESTAVLEAVRKEIPTVAIVDTNVDPSPINYPIPGNDDSRKSLALIFKLLADAVEEGYKGDKMDKETDGGELENLGLSVRSLNALKQAGVTSIEQIRRMSKEDLKAIKGLGEKSIKEVQTKLPSN